MTIPTGRNIIQNLVNFTEEGGESFHYDLPSLQTHVNCNLWSFREEEHFECHFVCAIHQEKENAINNYLLRTLIDAITDFDEVMYSRQFRPKSYFSALN